MPKKPRVTPGDRDFLLEVVEAVEKDLAGGRSPAAAARDLVGLGFDAGTARRLVRTVARGRGRRRPRRLFAHAGPSAPHRRLALAAAFGLAGAVAVYACCHASLYGFTFGMALVALLAGIVEAVATLRDCRPPGAGVPA